MKGTDTPQHASPWALGLGFTASAALVFGVISSIGDSLELTTRWSLLITITGVAALLLADLTLSQDGPWLSWHRQTPRVAIRKFGTIRGPLLWGLDVGTGFTTYRTTSLTWVGFIAAFAQIVPWWAGLIYAAGFVPAFIIEIYRPRDSHPSQQVFSSWLSNKTQTIWWTSLLLMLASVLAALADLMSL